VRSLIPNRSLAFPLQVALALLCLGPAALLAQTQEDFPGNEPGTTEERMERSDLGNVAQAALFSYAAGVRELEKAHKLKEKAAKADDSKRPKIEENIQQAYESAITNLTDAIQTNRNLIEAYDPLGRAYYQTGEFQRAAQVHDMALRIDPGHAVNQEGRAEAMLALHQIREAALAYESLRTADQRLAAQLLGLMKEYVSSHRTNPEGVPPEAVEALAMLIERWETAG